MHALLSRSGLAGLLFCVWSPVALAAGPADSLTDESGSARFVRTVQYLDGDQSGGIDAEELAAGQHMASLVLMLSWAQCDRDGDGVISAAEFGSAAAAAQSALLAAESERDEAAAAEFAQAMPVSLLLERLGANEQYADELAALRAAIADFDDNEEVVTHVIHNAARYPRLAPLVGTYARHYPAQPALRRLVPPRNTVGVKPTAKLKANSRAKGPLPKATVKRLGKPKVGKKPAAARPRSGGRRRP